MTTMTVVWLVLFAAAALLFFSLAAVIAVLGFRDLLDLLSGVKKRPSSNSAEL